MQSNIGKIFGEDQRHGMTPQALIKIRVLDDGKVEREYEALRSCRLFFIVNPITNIVEGWRYEGSDKDCSISN
jgi:hypothetical protein